ncbi:hypothetical protein H0H92_013414 [Tricholoma furcatifolium]|nr:hypothetical protein H0H92_013414 [Tricholoma furcatifolium]
MAEASQVTTNLASVSLADSTPAPATAQTNAANASTDQVVTPWDVQGSVSADGKQQAIDYDKLIDQFGTRRVDDALLARFERLTGQRPHDLRALLADDEKFLFKHELKVEQTKGFARQNARDIIAVGFDPKKTFIFSNYDYMGGAFYENVSKISRQITYSQAKATFGFSESDNIGKIHFAAIQAAPSFSNSFPQIFGTATSSPCLIPCAIDQDPYFRLTRDVAQKLKYQKPTLLHAKFFPALQGPQTKMSASDPNSSIYMSDKAAQIKNKINRHGFSGGQETEEEHRRLGGDTDVDVSYQYLTFFLDDDEELERLGKEYRAGTLLTGQLKAKCIEVLQKFVGDFQERKAKVTEAEINLFMDGTRAIEPTMAKPVAPPAPAA